MGTFKNRHNVVIVCGRTLTQLTGMNRSFVIHNY